MKIKSTEVRNIKRPNSPNVALASALRSNIMIVLLSSIAFSQAAVYRFELSPAGTDAAVGLSPGNELPAVANSTGSGNKISGGISFDTANSTLTFAIGYGSAAGFSDLSGPATAMHIHAAAGAGTNAPPLFDLAGFHFVAANPAHGGVIIGSIVYPSTDVPNLFAGLDYVNIHTALNPNGEIRGQLVPVINVAPEVTCPDAVTNECSAPATYTANVSDADGEPVEVVWRLNGTVVQTSNIPAGGPPTSAAVTFTATLPLGTNLLQVVATDSTGNSTTCSTTVTIADTIPPVIQSVSASPNVLWPPNHKMVNISVDAVVTDACGPTIWKIVEVSSSEAVNARGSGNTAPDYKITGNHTVQLRAERAGGNSAGRTYTITIQAKDVAGNLSDTAQVQVTVPHSRGR